MQQHVSASTAIEPCARRPFCGRAPVCSVCYEVGHALATDKLLCGGGQVQLAMLPELISTAWPSSTPIEVRAVIHSLLHGNRTANLRRTVATVNKTMVWHHVHAVLDDIFKLVPNVANIQPYLIANHIHPRQIDRRMYQQHRLHVVSQVGPKLLVRQLTALNATSSETLVRALLHRGSRGATLATVYAEYDGAYTHVHALPSTVVYRSLTHVWHASVAPVIVLGALARWRECRAASTMTPSTVSLPAHIRAARSTRINSKHTNNRTTRPRLSVHGARLDGIANKQRPRKRTNRSKSGLKLTL